MIFLDLLTNISEQGKTSFNIYPNPSEGVFNIKCNENNIGKPLRILDLTGRVVFNKNIENTFQTIDLSEFSFGIYIIIIIDQHFQKINIVR